MSEHDAGKTLRAVLEFKQDGEGEGEGDEGRVKARFATLGVKDLDGDVIEKGAIGRQPVRVSAFNHTSNWGPALPVGKGRIYEKGDAALAELEFFLDTPNGQEHFTTVKRLGELGEWSFGFEVIESAAPSEAQRQAGVVRVLKKLKVHEVSPVLRAAGVGTETLLAKAAAGPAPEPDLGDAIAIEAARYQLAKRAAAL
ncbi:HK97 family phage prohead protease [Candidatus Palauibacter sp.]|uniref:HK97 family phage prohead protease n=1 Tax=Candidatus Palauibacter sp. TaxID=3101350 RepID=UPI003CC50C2C